MKRVMVTGMIMAMAMIILIVYPVFAEMTLRYHDENTSFTTLFFLDRDTGWAGGIAERNGLKNIILRTTDGGETWVESSLPDSTIETVLEMSFVNKNVGFCLAGFIPFPPFYYSLFITHDGGEQWERVKELPDSIVAYSFCDENTGYAGVLSTNYYWRLMKTTDGGETWSEWRIENEMHHSALLDIVCAHPDTCYVLYGNNSYGINSYELTFLDVSYDGGATWNEQYAAEEKDHRTAGRIVLSSSHNNIWLLNSSVRYKDFVPLPGYSILTISSNKIESFKEMPGVWDIQSFDCNEALFFFYEHPEYDNRDCLLYSYNNGNTFELWYLFPEKYHENYSYTGYSFPEKNIAWFSTSYGHIFKYEHMTNSIKGTSAKPFPSLLTLHLPKPNPFNPTTTIRFSLSERSDVELIVYDCTGRKVATLLNGVPFAAGEHEVVFNGGGLASGVYLYVCRTGATQKSGTMAIVK